MNDINYEKFKQIIYESRGMNSDELIELHSSLIDKDYVNYTGYKCNCGIQFVYKILDCCWGKSIAVDYPKNYTNFFNTTYLSNYIKNFVKEKIDISNKSAMLQDIITGDRELKNLNEEEFNELNEVLKEIGYSSLLTVLSFELNSKGAIDFLNNRVEKDIVIRRIISTSGLSTRPEFYSGRGAKWCDLNGKMLILIYEKLARLDPKKGLNMAKMTLEMETLGATEFLENLYLLSANDFDLEKIELNNNNVSFGNLRGRSMYAIGLASLAASFGNNRLDDTPSIKMSFINMLPEEVIKTIDVEKIDYGNEYENPWEYPRVYRRKR